MLLFLALTACPGGYAKRAAPPGKKAPGVRAPIARTDGPTGIPKVILQVGTSFEPGRLSSFCDGKKCRTGALAPTTFLPAKHPLYFIISAAPKSAVLKVSAPGAPDAATQTALRPGNTMVYDPGVGPGRYVVTLEASWGRRSGSWVFGVEIPKSR